MTPLEFRCESARVFQRLCEVDPASPEYGQTMLHLERLCGLADFVLEFWGETPVTKAPDPAADETSVNEAPAVDEPQRTYTKEEVREKLTWAKREKGVDVTSLVKELGGTNGFSSLDPVFYPALMQELEAL